MSMWFSRVRAASGVVGRTPRSAPDALVRHAGPLGVLNPIGQRGQGAPRGPGGPPHRLRGIPSVVQACGIGPATIRPHSPRRGSALLMVLWISAALAAVAFSLANTVRGETDHTSTELEEVRSYYLAVGGVQRATVELLWTRTYQGEARIKEGASWVEYKFPTGVARVELIPEAAKFDVNRVPADRLMKVVTALGVEPGRAMEITQAILARRSGGAGVPSVPGAPSFPAGGASIQEMEELLAVRGVTPEIFYGGYTPSQDGGGSLTRQGGLVDCLSVFGTDGLIDAGGAHPAVLTALGMPADGVQALVALRRQAPLTQERLGQIASMMGGASGFLRVGGNTIYTLRSTAQVRLPNGQLSDVKRTVASQVKYMPPSFLPAIHILRWYDNTWSE